MAFFRGIAGWHRVGGTCRLSRSAGERNDATPPANRKLHMNASAFSVSSAGLCPWVPATPGQPAAVITRRRFGASLLLCALPGVVRSALAATNDPPAKPGPPSGRKLSLRVKLAGFGEASEPDIKAVLRSAGEEIWRHCPNTRFDEPGFEIYHHDKYPITHHERARDGAVVIGLATRDRFWAQYAFQFAHEFCHALISHSNDWRRLWRKSEHANQWLDETLCETASLFALRAMGRSWSTHPPFGNWKSFAPALTRYAQERLDDPKHKLPAGTVFAEWFAAELPGLRKAPTQRDKNTLMAARLLPLFEARPAGWESVTSLQLGSRDADKPLATHLAEWHANAPAAQKKFVADVAGVFGVKLAGGE